MEEHASKSLDIFGFKPVAESINKVTAASVDGAAAILSRICLPVAEEFGFLLRDRVRHWRALNIISITHATEAKLRQLGVPADAHAHPRITAKILEEGSWTDDVGVQDMWAGLLASSCTSDGRDDSNLIFIHLLSQVSRVQARLLNYASEKAEKILSESGLIMANELQATLEQLRAMTYENDIQRLDREMDHLRSLELLYMHSGFQFDSASPDADITPTSLALHLYARCQGFHGSPAEFFGVKSTQRPLE